MNSRQLTPTAESESIDRVEAHGMPAAYWSVSFRNLCGHNQRATSFALRFCIGTLEPISGLVQLTKLNLNNCRELTGTLLLFGHNFALM